MPTAPMRILLIEDDPEDASLLRSLLLRGVEAGPRFEVEHAATLAAGLERLARPGVDAVLLDLMLTDSRGLATAQAVLARRPAPPLVVLTGLSDEQAGLEAVRLGAQDYVLKGSFDARALRRAVAYAVHRHRAAAGMRAILERSADGMAVVDGRGVVRYANPAAEALLAPPGGALCGRPFPHPLPAEGLGEVPLPARGPGGVGELRTTPVEWEEAPATLAMLRDVSDLRRVAELKARVEEGKRMERLKDELMSAVSHEMRSPLTVIKAANINIKDGSCGPVSDEQATMLLLQEKNILRLQKILDHILDLSRLESGRAVIRPVELDPRPVLEEMARAYQLVAAERGVRVETRLPAALPKVHADPDLLAQVVGNLLDNAVRFTGTRVELKAAGPAPEGVVISVLDDGRGLPPERVGDVFKRFVQVDRPAGGEGYKGTGLGLAICKEIVERQGGRIWAESLPGAPGGRFHFSLPLSAPDDGD